MKMIALRHQKNVHLRIEETQTDLVTVVIKGTNQNLFLRAGSTLYSDFLREENQYSK
jgi:hypothetical protein